jgi:hypothetical protein
VEDWSVAVPALELDATGSRCQRRRTPTPLKDKQIRYGLRLWRAKGKEEVVGTAPAPATKLQFKGARRFSGCSSYFTSLHTKDGDTILNLEHGNAAIHWSG